MTLIKLHGILKGKHVNCVSLNCLAATGLNSSCCEIDLSFALKTASIGSFDPMIYTGCFVKCQNRPSNRLYSYVTVL